jgi:crooked neck
LSKLPRSKSINLYTSYTKFEKQHGTRSTVESTVWNKRRIQYEDEVSNDPFNYDTWFDFARLEEDALRALRDDGEDEDEIEKAIGRVREVYERAVANKPLANEKRLWRRYIFLWLYYAVFEESETKVPYLSSCGHPSSSAYNSL